MKISRVKPKWLILKRKKNKVYESKKAKKERKRKRDLRDSRISSHRWWRRWADSWSSRWTSSRALCCISSCLHAHEHIMILHIYNYVQTEIRRCTHWNHLYVEGKIKFCALKLPTHINLLQNFVYCEEWRGQFWIGRKNSNLHVYNGNCREITVFNTLLNLEMYLLQTNWSPHPLGKIQETPLDQYAKIKHILLDKARQNSL